MRIVRIPLLQERILKDALTPETGGGLSYRTRIPLRRDEPVILDLRMLRHNLAMMMRGRVAEIEADGDQAVAKLALEFRDGGTREFLDQLAHGKLFAWTNARRGNRYPVALRADWKSESTNETYTSMVSDLSWAGAFVRTLSLPPVGSRISLSIGAPAQEGGMLELNGLVARTRARDDADVGMAIHFTDENPSRRRLRQMLRRMELRGSLAFPS